MSQPILPSLQEHGEGTVEPLADPPDVHAELALPEAARAPVTLPVDRSRLGLVMALVGLGLLLQGTADTLGRDGHQSRAVLIFLVGISLHFAACAWRLLSRNTSRSERISVSLVLGLGLFASYAMLETPFLDSYDELIHWGTFIHLLDSHALFPANTELPVSPYYPGLELATAATRWITGLPLVVDQLIVLAVVRILVVLGVYLVVERLCRSSRAGGVAVLVYAASPQFYSFDAQYAYETIALAFAVGTVYLLFFSIDSPRPRAGGAFVLALGSVVAVVISHHVTGWLTIGFLVAWFIGLYYTSHPLRRARAARTRSSVPDSELLTAPSLADSEELIELSPGNSGQVTGRSARSRPSSKKDRAGRDGPTSEQAELNRRRRAQARIVGVATLLGLVVGGSWTLYVGHLLAPYLGPLFSSAAAEIRQALGNGEGNRALFKASSGGVSPKWEIGLILLSALGWCLILLPSLYNVVFKRSIRGGVLRYIPVAIAAAYPLTVVANVSSNSKLVAERATTFIFFGIAAVVGAWLGGRMLKDRRRIERVATLGVATVIFLGSLLYGIGPPVSLLPGPYRVGGDSLAYGSPSFAVAQWANTHLPAGSHIAADHDNGVLLNAIGGVDTVTAEAGLVNPELLYFDRALSLYDIYLIRKADIRYIVVDDRMAESLPLYGTYIATGEPSRRLTSAELGKFTKYDFIKRIYDNGPIQVYDVTGLLKPSQRAAPAGTPVGGSGYNVIVLVLAGAVAVLWLVRLRRRRRRIRDAAHLIFCILIGALMLGVFGVFVIRGAHAPPETVAIIVLLVLLALSLRPEKWRPRNWIPFRRRAAGTAHTATVNAAFEPPSSPAASNGSRPRRIGILLGCVGVALFVLGAIVATKPALSVWTPPPELSIAQSSNDQSVARVQLGSAGPVASRLEITESGRTVWHRDLAKTTVTQSVDLPANLLHKGSRVELLAQGQALRWVNGWASVNRPPAAGTPGRL
ncbi:MAG TPA: glycosyltransferase family 39 protein [Acidimicrobiales bacterium]|nr:glycosyltransferase family 39 protein [Acidimicrobiales bacterium]